MNPEDVPPDLFPTEAIDFFLVPEKLNVDQMTTLIMRNKGEHRTDEETGKATLFAPWEDEDTHRIFRLFKWNSSNGYWYALHVRTISETEPRCYNYWAGGMSYEDPAGTLTNTKDEAELRTELTEMLQTGLADRPQLDPERKKELTSIASHVAVELAMEQPGADQLIADIEYGNPIREIASFSELFNMSKTTGIFVDQSVFHSTLKEILKDRQQEEFDKTQPKPVVADAHPWLDRSLLESEKPRRFRFWKRKK